MVVKHNVKRKALVLLIAPKPELPEELASFTAEGLQRIGKRFREEKSRAIWVCCDMDVLKPTKPSQRNQTPNTSQCGERALVQDTGPPIHYCMLSVFVTVND
jgi:hypothetical protein